MQRFASLPAQARRWLTRMMPRDDQQITVEFQPIGRREKVSPGQTLLVTAQSAGVELQAVCGGKGTCGQCKVRMTSGTLSEPTTEEKENLLQEQMSAGFRLACQAIPVSDVSLEIPPESLTSSQRVQVESEVAQLLVDPVRSFPAVQGKRQPLGLAIDLGTTKIAAYLVDLETGETLAHRGQMNPQIAYGEDVISRISYASQSKECEERLRRKVVGALNQLAKVLCHQAHVTEEEIFEVVVAGNTAMHHLFADFPVRQLGAAPYLPASTVPAYRSAGEFGLCVGLDARVYTPPNIAGYVGGDHVAMLLGIGIVECPEPTLAIDLGTNTELTLKANGRLLTCSCASGPAFEGAHIKHGMRAAPGAIERVFFHEGVIHCYTIDRRAACGICGSGILDAIAALLDAEAIDARGNFRKDVRGVRQSNGELEFVLVPAAGIQSKSEIVITRQDIGEIQFAKAAIRAGIEVLLDVAQVNAAALTRFVIAGAFGSYLDVRSAVRTGLFPAVSMAKFTQVGNAAGAGARKMLVSARERQEGEELARRIEYVELTSHPWFHEKFVKALLF